MSNKLFTAVFVFLSFQVFCQNILKDHGLGLDLPFYESDFITKSNDGNYFASGKIYKYDFVELFSGLDSTFNALLKFDPQGNTLNFIELEGYINFDLYSGDGDNSKIHFIKENNDKSITYFSGLNVYKIDKDLMSFTLLESFEEPGVSYSNIKSKVYDNTLIISCNQIDQNNNYSGLEVSYDLEQMSINSRNTNDQFYNVIDVEKNQDGNSFRLFNNNIVKNNITNSEIWSYNLTSKFKINDIVIGSQNEILAIGLKIEGAKKLGVILKLSADGQYVDEKLIDRNPVYDLIGASVIAHVELTKIELVENGSMIILGREHTEWSHAYKVALKIDSNFNILWDYRPGDVNTTQNTYDHLLLTDDGNYIITGTQFRLESPPVSSISIISKENSVNNKNIIEEKISIFPNPSSDIIVLKNENSIKNLKYTIYNCEGQVVKKGFYYSNINIANLVQGQYFLHLANKKTNTIQRFIKM